MWIKIIVILVARSLGKIGVLKYTLLVLNFIWELGIYRKFIHLVHKVLLIRHHVLVLIKISLILNRLHIVVNNLLLRNILILLLKRIKLLIILIILLILHSLSVHSLLVVCYSHKLLLGDLVIVHWVDWPLKVLVIIHDHLVIHYIVCIVVHWCTWLNVLFVVVLIDSSIHFVHYKLVVLVNLVSNSH